MAGAKWQHTTAEDKDGHGHCGGQQNQSSKQNGLTCVELSHWLVDHGIPRSEIDVRPTKFFSCISEGIPDQEDKTLI